MGPIGEPAARSRADLPLQDYNRTERAVRRRAEGDGQVVEAGTRVTVCVKGVPESVGAAYDAERPFMLFGLFQHEHKVSVLNFKFQRNAEYTAPVRSKDELVLCVGPRRFPARPVFSQHTRGGGRGVNNVHKVERFLRPGETSVATVFAPAVFGVQPWPPVVASDVFLAPDPTRVVAKRVVLTGHPFKVRMNTATVRYMFFVPENAAYSERVSLHTKLGRTRYIRAGLGRTGTATQRTGQRSMNTLDIPLYKRVYPEWATCLRLLVRRN